MCIIKFSNGVWERNPPHVSTDLNQEALLCAKVISSQLRLVTKGNSDASTGRKN